MSKTRLKISAATEYNPKNPCIVPVNNPKDIISLDGPLAHVKLAVYIKNFQGSTHHESHSFANYPDNTDKHNLKMVIQIKPKVSIRADRLLFGNDFSYPVREFLPYGTSTALRVFKYLVDPSVDGDLYDDENGPWLYGRAMSSFNKVKIIENDDEFSTNIDEHTGLLNNNEIPTNPRDRQQYFTNIDNLKATKLSPNNYYVFVFETDMLSLDNNDFKIMLPGGFGIDLKYYLDKKIDKVEGAGSVRWVLKAVHPDEEIKGVRSGDPLLIITFELVKE
ncbi:hypothetical protein DASC09_017430 [Saccharomycopsis crataegensis]|uniref:Domain of unknown function at the cortex 1 domain-containing protein n=1 Tax=Saccharomycopsis crataegensis TaxID=43959 RepID=A0AAV5QI11_9ASCO|nr:hypothetical protein DASC09_017430 [Saccharomycopsis crataegensis]